MYKTLFTVGDQLPHYWYHDYQLEILITLLLACGIAAIYNLKEFSKGVRKQPLNNLSISLCFSIAFIAAYHYPAPDDLRELTHNLNSNVYETVEGSIKLEHTLEGSRQWQVDVVHIDKKTFYIGRNLETAAYNLPIAQGGYLKNETMARLSYVKNKIIKVEIKS